MKRLILLILLWLQHFYVAAQTLQEWTKQDATQIAYLLKQIAALKFYTSNLIKGYGIVTEGSSWIGKIKSDDMALHQDVFQSLTSVTNEVRNAQQVTEILMYSWKSVKQTTSITAVGKSSRLFTNAERAYFESIKKALNSNVFNNLNHLFLITQSNSFQMNAWERLNQLDKLYKKALSNYTFSKTFASEVAVITSHRKSEPGEVEKLKVIHQLKK